MRWRESEAGWLCGDKQTGGQVWETAFDGWGWLAWVSDASTHLIRPRPYKTLKAAQRAVEKWLEKHG